MTDNRDVNNITPVSKEEQEEKDDKKYENFCNWL